MVDDEPIPPHDDYDLLTHYVAGKRLIDDIKRERQLCDDSPGAAGEAHRARLAALENAMKRHRDCRPAERPTFFSAMGVVERIDTAERL